MYHLNIPSLPKCSPRNTLPSHSIPEGGAMKARGVSPGSAHNPPRTRTAAEVRIRFRSRSNVPRGTKLPKRRIVALM